QLPGRDGRVNEAPHSHYHQIADQVSDALQEHRNYSKRVIFWGHSFGSLIAYETSRYWSRKYNSKPNALVVSGRNAPMFSCTKVYDLPKEEFYKYLKELGGI